MNKLWTGLLLMHGYITDLELVRRLSGVRSNATRHAERNCQGTPPPRKWPPTPRRCLGIGDGAVREQ